LTRKEKNPRDNTVRGKVIMLRIGLKKVINKAMVSPPNSAVGKPPLILKPEGVYGKMKSATL
jgi:hypothetical protein